MKKRRVDLERIDWILLSIAVGAAWCLPLLIRDIRLVPEGNRLLGAALWALGLSLMLSRTRWPQWTLWLAGLVLGVEYSIQFAGKLLPSLGMLWRDGGRLLSWLWETISKAQFSPLADVLATPGYVGFQVTDMLARLSAWYTAVASGGTSQDNTALWFTSAFIVWLLTWNMAVQLFRTRRPFAGMLPLAIVIVSAVSYTYIGMRYVHAFVALALLAVVRTHVHQLEAFWAKLHLDYSPELRRDATVAGGVLATIVLVVALIVPYVTYNRALWAFWDLVGPKITSFYDEIDRAFAGRNPVPSPTAGAQDLGGHNVASGGALGEDTLFYVEVSDPPPPSETELSLIQEQGEDISTLITKRYWRERTYDVYTGHGWDTSARVPQAVRAEDSWIERDYPYEVVTQTYTLLDQQLPFGFAVNELVAADQDYELVLRDNDDLAAFRVRAPSYQVLSQAPVAEAFDLLAAEGAYPGWIAERYLALPEIPDTIGELAQSIVAEANATTRYEMARAIERHIRGFAYDLDIAPPELDADIVEYFLFDAQRGYCDYSATAMVVMLRSLGVAARYASGYNMGNYSDSLEAWVVTQANAHAWAEVYFPGYGWIEFEPTPTQYVFDRGRETPRDLEPLPTPMAEQESSATPTWLWLVGALLVIAFVVIWPPRWFQRQRTPDESVVRVYDRLVRQSRWAGLGPVEGQTPREYLGDLAHGLQRHAPEQVAQDALRTIDQAYQQARYADLPLEEAQALRVETAWRLLRGPILRATLHKPDRRNHHDQPTV